jgi:hypothetical protein
MTAKAKDPALWELMVVEQALRREQWRLLHGSRRELASYPSPLSNVCSRYRAGLERPCLDIKTVERLPAEIRARGRLSAIDKPSSAEADEPIVECAGCDNMIPYSKWHHFCAGCEQAMLSAEQNETE